MPDQLLPPDPLRLTLSGPRKRDAWGVRAGERDDADGGVSASTIGLHQKGRCSGK